MTTENKLTEEDNWMLESAFTALSNNAFKKAKELITALIIKRPQTEEFYALRRFCTDNINAVPITEDIVLKEKLGRFLNSRNFKGGLAILDSLKHAPAPTLKNNAQDILLYNAEQVFKMKKYDKAIELLTQFIDGAESLDKALGYQRRALAYLLSCNKVYARTDYKNYLTELEKNAEEDLEKAEICLRLKDFDNAIFCYDAAKTKLNLDNIFIGKAACYKNKNKYFEADAILQQGIEEVSALIKENALFWKLYESRSQIYCALKKYDLALGDINRAMALWDISVPNPYYAERAKIYSKMGEHNKALTDINKANRMTFNSNPEYLLQQAEIFLKLSNYALALESYKEAQYAAKNDDICQYKALNGIAKIQRKLGNENIAAQFLEKARKLENFGVLLNKYQKELEDLI